MKYTEKSFTLPASAGGTTEKNWDRAFLSPEAFAAKYPSSEPSLTPNGPPAEERGTCPRCKGTAVFSGDQCSTCQGSGIVQWYELTPEEALADAKHAGAVEPEGATSEFLELMREPEEYDFSLDKDQLPSVPAQVAPTTCTAVLNGGCECDLSPLHHSWHQHTHEGVTVRWLSKPQQPVAGGAPQIPPPPSKLRLALSQNRLEEAWNEMEAALVAERREIYLIIAGLFECHMNMVEGGSYDAVAIVENTLKIGRAHV